MRDPCTQQALSKYQTSNGGDCRLLRCAETRTRQRGETPHPVLATHSLMDGELREDGPGGALLRPQGALSPFKEAVVGQMRGP